MIILCGYVEIFVNLIDSSLGTTGVGSDALIAKINVLRVLRLARISDQRLDGGLLSFPVVMVGYPINAKMLSQQREQSLEALVEQSDEAMVSMFSSPLLAFLCPTF